MDNSSLALCQAVLTWLERLGRHQARLTTSTMTGWEWAIDDPRLRFLTASLYILERQGALHLSAEERQACQQTYYTNSARWLRTENHLSKVLEALTESGIQAILLKGADLNSRLYSTPGLRSMGDVDLLVPDSAFEATVDLILKQGFDLRDKELLPEIKGASDIARPYEITFIHPKGLPLDLHRHFIGTAWFLPAYPIEMQAVLDRTIRLEGDVLNTASVLSTADTLAFLCLHLAMHGLQVMHGYLDVDLWIRNLPPDWDWQGFIRQIIGWQMKNVVYHVFAFCRDFMDTPLPMDVLTQLDPGTAARLRLRTLITSQALLEGRNTIGQSYPTLVKLALVQDGWTIAKLLWQALVNRPGGVHSPSGRRSSLIGHWKHILEVVKRGD
jgi:hypothetical protein